MAVEHFPFNSTNRYFVCFFFILCKIIYLSVYISDAEQYGTILRKRENAYTEKEMESRRVGIVETEYEENSAEISNKLAISETNR